MRAAGLRGYAKRACGDDFIKKISECDIIKNSEIAQGVFDLTLKSAYLQSAAPGQFVGVYPDGGGFFLPRPFAVAQTDRARETVRIVYRVAGEGTAILSRKQKGGLVRLLGPCGTGFPIGAQEKVILTGGGMGCAPLLFLAQTIKNANPNAEMQIFLGFKSKSDCILENDFLNISPFLRVCTQDGSYGEKGVITDILPKEQDEARGTLYAAGPHQMLAALYDWSKAQKISAFFSLEERMACCVGACLCCALKTKTPEGIKNKLVCTDGPVFAADEVFF